MRYAPISPNLFHDNRVRLRALMRPRTLAMVNNNDILPTNADGTLILQPNKDLFYLTGITQEESLVVLFPEACDPRDREILFLREVSPHLETWEGRKLSKEAAQKISGIERIEWLSCFSTVFRNLMCEAEGVYLNQNEHPRAVVTVQTREVRFVTETMKQYPLHEYHRLARLMHSLRQVKSASELALLQRAIEITKTGFERAARFTRPGVNEMEVEAEYIHEFTRQGGAFAYSPIIGSGINATSLHYNDNCSPCEVGQMLLLDVASSYAHYNADLTRTIPVSGVFTDRQREVYEAVLRVFRASAALLKPGVRPLDWRNDCEQLMEKELVDLKLLTMSELKNQGPDKPATKRCYPHGIGHSIGLDVHDVVAIHEPMQAGWVVTCEPGIYIQEEELGIRLENMILITEDGSQDLMMDIPIEAEEIESLMACQKI